MAKTYTPSVTNAGTESGTKESASLKKEVSSKEPSLKGAFVAVMLLGGFIVISWVLVLTLFLSRN